MMGTAGSCRYWKLFLGVGCGFPFGGSLFVFALYLRRPAMADFPGTRFKHLGPRDVPAPSAAEAERQTIDLEPLTPEPVAGGFSRRTFLSGLSAAGVLSAAPMARAVPVTEPETVAP